MALINQAGPVPDVSDRFSIAQDAPVPEDIADRQVVQRQVRKEIYSTAKMMVVEIEQSRELSLALTHLEEALMWAGKAIFK